METYMSKNNCLNVKVKNRRNNKALLLPSSKKKQYDIASN